MEKNFNMLKVGTKIYEKILVNSKEQFYQIKQYIITKFLGKGSFGICYEVIEVLTHQKYAIKVISKEFVSKKKCKININLEISILNKLSHKNIIKIFSDFEDDDNIYILMELCERNTLWDLLKSRNRFSIEEITYIASELLNAIEYLHSKNIIHRDIKLKNIFITEDYNIKLADFGLSTICYSNEKVNNVCGTANYLAPEVIDKNSIGYSHEIDVWAFGIILYYIFYKKLPFDANDKVIIYDKILSVNLRFPEYPKIPDNLKNLIKNILVKDLSCRYTIDQIKKDSFINNHPINNPFFNSAIVNIPNSTLIPILENTPINADYDYIKVINWISCSAEIKLAYLLSNLTVGLIFKDNHHLIISEKDKDIYCIDINNDFKTEKFTKESIPVDLQTKYKLLISYKKYFIKYKNWESEINNPECESSLIYIRRYFRDKYLIAFKFSDKNYQFIFRDKTVIYLDHKKELVYYTDKQKKIITYIMSENDFETIELKDKIRYIKKCIICKFNLKC